MFLFSVEPLKFCLVCVEFAEILSGTSFLAYVGIQLNVGGRG